MKGAIFFSSKYGSTGQYANWISEATGFPVFNVKDRKADPSNFDLLIIGFPVIYHKLYRSNWVEENLNTLMQKPVILFSVSGAPAGAKLDGWIDDSLPQQFISHMKHVVLGGRQNPKDLTLYDRMMLIIGSWINKDPKASKEEIEGFDYMDKAGIQPILEMVQQFNVGEAASKFVT